MHLLTKPHMRPLSSSADSTLCLDCGLVCHWACSADAIESESSSKYSTGVSNLKMSFDRSQCAGFLMQQSSRENSPNSCGKNGDFRPLTEKTTRLSSSSVVACRRILGRTIELCQERHGRRILPLPPDCVGIASSIATGPWYPPARGEYGPNSPSDDVQRCQALAAGRACAPPAGRRTLLPVPFR